MSRMPNMISRSISLSIFLLFLSLLTIPALAAPPTPVPEPWTATPQPTLNPLEPPENTSAYGMDILGPAWQWTFPREEASPRLDGPIRIDQLDEVISKSWQAGVRSARVAAWWCFLEPERDQFRWEDMDIMVQLLRNYGIEPIPEVLYTPYWARSGAPAPRTSCIDNWQRNHAPDDIADWQAFMRAFVQRYGSAGKNQVHRWEIWNEPDLPEFLTNEGGFDEDTVCIYARLLKAASQEVRSQDPQAQVVLGGLSDINGPDFLDKLLSASCGADVRDDFDILAFHAFTAHDIKVFLLNNVLKKHEAAGRYELWINEFNNIGWGKDYTRADDELPGLLASVFNADVSRIFWFKSWTTKWQADWTVGIFEDRDPLWVPGPFVPSPFFDSYQRQAIPQKLAAAPQLMSPGLAALVTSQPTFFWQRPAAGDFPIAGYKLQIDDSTYQGVPYFHAPEIDAWVAASNTTFLPLQWHGPSVVHQQDKELPVASLTALASTRVRYQAARALPPGRYYWRVAAVDTQGNVGPYSDVQVFYVIPGNERVFLPLQMP